MVRMVGDGTDTSRLTSTRRSPLASGVLTQDELHPSEFSVRPVILRQRWAEAAADIEEALASRVSDEMELGTDYVVMLDGHACRRMWSGLHNENQSHQEAEIDDPRT